MKMNRFSWLFALTILAALPVSAQSPWVGPLTPTQPTTSDRVSLDFMVSTSPNDLCDLMLPGEVDVSREGGNIHIQYTLRERTENDPPSGMLCVSAYVPVNVTADLGYLPVGDYVTTISTTVADFSGTYPPEYSMSFTVRGSATGGGAMPDPEVIPPEPNSADSIQLLITDGVRFDGCNLAMSEPPAIVRDGNSISVNYALQAVPSTENPDCPAFGTFVPHYFWVELGRLPPGAYEVTVNGSFDGAALQTQAVAFGVGVAQASFIPTNATWALSLMLLALGSVAMWRLRMR